MKNMQKLFLFIFFFLTLCLFAKDNVVTINFAIGTNTPDLEYTKSELKKFEKENQNIKVNILRLSTSASENYAYILQMLEAKSSNIDIFAIATPWNGDLASNLIDLSKYLGKSVEHNYLENALQMCIVDKKMVSAPWNVDCGILYYRSDLLKKYNLKVPKTWLELTKAAYTIENGEHKAGNKDFVGYVWQGNSYEGLTCNALEWIASNNGGTIVNKEKQITINNPNAVKAIQLAKKWIGTISPEGVLSMQEEDCRNTFQSGNAAFMRNWPYCYSLLIGDESKVKTKFAVTTLPAGENDTFKSTISGWGLGISKYSKHPEEASKVIKFLTSNSFELGRAVKLGGIPTVKSVYKEEKFKKAVPFYKVIEKSIEHGVPCPAIQTAPNYNKVSQLFYTTVYSILTGKKNTKTALSELAGNIHSTTDLKETKF